MYVSSTRIEPQWGWRKARSLRSIYEDAGWLREGMLRFEQAARALRAARAAQQGSRTAFAWTDLHDWRQRTFGGRELPNPVLTDRDEAPF